jgi:general stress protein 26
MEWTDVAPHLVGLAHLATVTGDGKPHVAIVSPRVEGDILWLGALRSSKKVRNVTARPFGALVWSGTAEAYVDVAIEIVDLVSEKRRLWEGWAYDPAVFFASPDNEDYVLLRCTPISATLMTAGDSGPLRQRWKPSR